MFILQKYNKVYKYIMAIFFLLFIGIIFISNIVTPKRIFSDSENRRLEQAPKFSLKRILKGEFTSNYEKYISDQFVLRDLWIGVKSEAEVAIGKKDNNGVYLGKDGYLLQNFKKSDVKELKDKINVINSFAASTPNLNKYFMLVPNSMKVLEDKLPPYAPVDDELTYINKVKNSMDSSVNFIDLYNTLYSKKDEYIYYKTDHHWTTKGAYYAYKKICEDIGITPHDESYFDVKKVTDSFYGTQYSKGGFKNIQPDSIELYLPKGNEKYNVEYYDENKTTNSLYDMNNLNKKDKYTVFFNGNHPFMKISTNIKNGKKLLVIKDSYANSFIPFLTGHYSEIYVVDLRYYTDNLNKLVKSNDINDMLILYNAKSFFEDENITSNFSF
ncbi:DHHW family protein [Haloimpatiens sp. FM7330]|uniref:DHHW family protein n=1 Tax=Haloimpatiens sp. FM7330 TaxID=3298610 RepID=UPI003634ADA3